MKHLIRTMTLSFLLAAATVARAGESKRGFYETDLAGGGKIVFFVQANHSLSTYIFNKAGSQASLGGGPIADDGSFSLTTSANQVLSGTLTPSTLPSRLPLSAER